MPRDSIRAVAAVAAVAAGLGTAGCAHTDHMTVSHRHALGGEVRIVILPVGLPEESKLAEGTGQTLATLYATELLKSYEILDYRRFQKMMEARDLDLETILENGAGADLVDELEVDAILLSEVYSWQPGVPGFWFLAKTGRVGFLARLIDLRSGSVIWSANRVRDTRPQDPLSVGLSMVFRDLAAEMPPQLAAF